MASSNDKILNATVEIVKSILGNPESQTYYGDTETITNLIEAIYNKLDELDEKRDKKYY